MVIQLALGSSTAWAQAMTVAPTVGVVGEDEVGMRPGLRVGFEPSPAVGLDLLGDLGLDGRWDAGLGLVGRLWFAEAEGTGIYGLGRFAAGFTGNDADVGPWTGLSLGFGGRPAPWLDLAVDAGPEWAATVGPRWRTQLGVALVIGADTFSGSGPGVGSVRHRPRKIH